MIRVRRAYDVSADGPLMGEGGQRFLVDRLWPRAVKKEALQPFTWAREAAPSDALRQWFRHDPQRWDEFQRRYWDELDGRPQSWQPILDAARRGDVVLLFGARDEQHNQAVALKAYLEGKMEKAG